MHLLYCALVKIGEFDVWRGSCGVPLAYLAVAQYIRQVARCDLPRFQDATVHGDIMHGDGEVGIEGQNKGIADSAKRFPDRLIAFLSVDPRRPDAIEMVERCVNDWGMKGLK